MSFRHWKYQPNIDWTSLSHAAHVRNTGLAMAIAISSFPETLGSKKGWRLFGITDNTVPRFISKPWEFQVVISNYKELYTHITHLFETSHKFSPFHRSVSRLENLSSTIRGRKPQGQQGCHCSMLCSKCVMLRIFRDDKT